jgi:hypothetical protein
MRPLRSMESESCSPEDRSCASERGDLNHQGRVGHATQAPQPTMPAVSSPAASSGPAGSRTSRRAFSTSARRLTIGLLHHAEAPDSYCRACSLTAAAPTHGILRALRPCGCVGPDQRPWRRQRPHAAPVTMSAVAFRAGGALADASSHRQNDAQLAARRTRPHQPSLLHHSDAQLTARPTDHTNRRYYITATHN